MQLPGWASCRHGKPSSEAGCRRRAGKEPLIEHAHGISWESLEAHAWAGTVRLLHTARSSMSHCCGGARTLEEQRCWADKPGGKLHIKRPPCATFAPILQDNAKATFSTFALTPKTPPPPPRVSRRTEQENLRLLLRDYHGFFVYPLHW